MLFVVLVRFSKKPTLADQAEMTKRFAEQEKVGIRTVCAYTTFGRYDAIRIVEAPNEKVVLKALMKAPEYIHTETMLAVDREEVTKLLA
jgi:uncharacterized protein with GYD domain